MTRSLLVRTSAVHGLLITLVLLAGGGTAHADGPLVVYHREFGGFVGGVADVRVERDGRTTASSTRCGGERHTFELTAKRLHRLRSALRHARREAHPRRRDVGGPEASVADITSGRLRLYYRGFGSEPEGARPLIQRLDRIAELRC